MKVRKISEHITKLEVWCFIKISAWLVQAEGGVYIVDTGMAFLSNTILREAEKLGTVKAILLTHGHSDHAGGVQNILRKRNIPVYAHALDLDYMEGKAPFPRRKKAEKVVPPHVVQPLPTAENGQLAAFGDLVPYHTPGHSPGHVAYYHTKDRVLLSGDLFTSKHGQLQKPMKSFTAYMDQAIASGRIVQELKPALVSITHSNDVSDAHLQIEQYLKQSAI